MIRLPFVLANEKFLKSFINKLEIFTKYKVKLNIAWNTQKIKSLFNNKDKVSHYSCVIYRGLCVTLDYDAMNTKMVQIRISNELNIYMTMITMSLNDNHESICL